MMINLKTGKLTDTLRSLFEHSFGESLADVSIRVDRKVDRYLAHLGALAEARDTTTILFSTHLAALPEEARMEIIGHELAHTLQLRRHGSDPTEFLEAKAWQASRAALSGTAYEIRGRASWPLQAKGLFIT